MSLRKGLMKTLTMKYFAMFTILPFLHQVGMHYSISPEYFEKLLLGKNDLSLSLLFPFMYLIGFGIIHLFIEIIHAIVFILSYHPYQRRMTFLINKRLRISLLAITALSSLKLDVSIISTFLLIYAFIICSISRKVPPVNFYNRAILSLGYFY